MIAYVMIACPGCRECKIIESCYHHKPSKEPKEDDYGPFPRGDRGLSLEQWMERGLCRESAEIMIGRRRGNDVSVGGGTMIVLQEEWCYWTYPKI